MFNDPLTPPEQDQNNDTENIKTVTVNLTNNFITNEPPSVSG